MNLGSATKAPSLYTNTKGGKGEEGSKEEEEGKIVWHQGKPPCLPSSSQKIWKLFSMMGNCHCNVIIRFFI